MKLKKALLWIYMLSKRLILKWSFTILLLSIPLLIVGVNAAMKGDSGVLTIHLCADENNYGANEVIENILNQKTSILFIKNASLDNSLKALENGKIDAIWYFEDNLCEKIDDYASGKNKSAFIKVFEKDDTIPLRLSREKLFGGVFNMLSYSLYRDFVCSEYELSDTADEDVIKSYIGKRGDVGDIVSIQTLEGEVVNNSSSYLTAPLRGLMALIVMFCGFASALVFVDDRKKGKFDWLTPKKHIIPAFAQCFSGVLQAAVVVVISLWFSGSFTGVLRECTAMLLYVFATTLFCLNLCMIFKSPLKLGAIIPALVIGVLGLSPVFFDINILHGLKLIVPTYHYLHFVYDTSYLGGFVAYILCASALAVIVNVKN